ncbi:YbhB/YbcL family Raf kinase inhibitor-like protein [Sinimarinibacterium sp. CAU 1509]|uniref:YbhB/YbcL family Raf kinase inhibitor-like protein n=1 Tax=Sinimarinibacterium sp. CAU 1509 TaxID=2562283 RepID=UPI0010AB68FD|nr:YbhB/YbcL family Raf kinase inhibitor-like protein [Sinimarinibacterium sp. CAU 1509]TJY59467.1 YbhB/YbcL family Raf kinase inhibitor-like protein [Sinimarinibacterium sp. CAU 1509]
MRILAIGLLAVLAPLAQARAAEFMLGSSDIDPATALAQTFVYQGFGCSGDNRSPALRWSGAPSQTRSFALTVYDPDAPTGSGWWHWVVVNLPATTQALPQGAGDAAGTGLPDGALQIRTDFGVPGYGGPCPPPGDTAHRYIVTLYALKTEHLDLTADVSAAMAGFMIKANAIAQTQFEVRYGR